MTVRAIVGSREFGHMAAIDRYVSIYCDPKQMALVSGGAEGVDHIARATAEVLGFTRVRTHAYHTPEQSLLPGVFVEVRPAYHALHPKLAPKHRNAVVADICTEMVAFWNGNPHSGTLTAVRHAAHMGKPVGVYEYSGGKWRVHDGRVFAYKGFRAGWPRRAKAA